MVKHNVNLFLITRSTGGKTKNWPLEFVHRGKALVKMANIAYEIPMFVFESQEKDNTVGSCI